MEAFIYECHLVISVYALCICRVDIAYFFGNIIIDNCAIKQALKTGNSVIDRDV